MKKYLSLIIAEVVILSLFLAPFVYPAKAQTDLRWFENYEELQSWCDNNTLPIILIANADGVIDLVNPGKSWYDCEDYAEELMRRAARDGYLLPMCPVMNGRVFLTHVSDYYEPHVGNWTRIGNEAYYIEPQPLIRHIVKIGNMD